MKVKKTVTEKVVAANRSNSAKSTGPKDTQAVNQNARKHGLFAKHLKFESAEEEEEFKKLLRDFEEEYEPSSATEAALVEEGAVCLWKLGIIEGWAMQEFANRRKAAQAIVQAVADNADGKQLPFFTLENGSRSAGRLGWDCQELIIRNDTSEHENEVCVSDTKASAGRVLIEARLNSSIEMLVRYQASLKKDFYRAIAMLRDLQRKNID